MVAIPPRPWSGRRETDVMDTAERERQRIRHRAEIVDGLARG